jgi:hypothetical protein
MGLTKSPKVSTIKISPIEIPTTIDYQCEEMLIFPQSHIQITDKPYLGLLLHLNQQVSYEQVTGGQNEVKITNKP